MLFIVSCDATSKGSDGSLDSVPEFSLSSSRRESYSAAGISISLTI